MAARVSLALRFRMIGLNRPQSGQGMVEYALILALVALIVIVALIATGGQLINLFSNITRTMCLYKVGC